LVDRTEKVPETTNEVSNNEGKQNKSEDFVDIKHHVLGNNLFISGGVWHQWLNKFVEPRNINELD
jgi:hypothetical protein